MGKNRAAVDAVYTAVNFWLCHASHKLASTQLIYLHYVQ